MQPSLQGVCLLYASLRLNPSAVLITAPVRALCRPCLQLRARPSDVKDLAAHYLAVHRTRTTGGQSLLLGTPALRCGVVAHLWAALGWLRHVLCCPPARRAGPPG